MESMKKNVEVNYYYIFYIIFLLGVIALFVFTGE